MNGYSAVGHYGGDIVNVRHFFKDDLTKDTVTIIHLTNGRNKYFNPFDFSYTLASEVMTEMINILGYNVMLTLGPHKAIPMFELNCQDNPYYSNAFDSLAEAHLNAKNMNKAKTFYHKALELEPGNQRIQKILKGLKK